MSERITQAWTQFRRNVRAIHTANGIDIKPGSDQRYAPTGDDGVFDGVDATPEELLLYSDRRAARTRSQLGTMQRYALSGLATEMTMHEANGLLSTMRYGTEHFVSEYPDDRTAHSLAHATRRLQEDFSFLCRFRASGSGYSHQTTEKLMEIVSHEFSRGIAEGSLVIEASDAFMATKFDLNPRVLDSVLINLVRNSYYWGYTTGRKPVIVRFDVEQMEYERDTWDEDTDVYGTETALTDIIVVEDNGPGLPQGLGDEVFEVGVSGRRSSGIGLHICRIGLESHAQTIVVAEDPSELGGAKFRIGRAQSLRPDQVSLDSIEKPREAELAEALESMAELVRNGDNVEAAQFGDVYEEAAGVAFRIRLRGAESHIEEKLVEAVDEIHQALSGHDRAATRKVQGR
ncbi:hypothetical protein G6L37_35075 [Agrobacterium rubi]|nr:hypothetical protein [Agrobacterium rubi]NTF23793.1 hypothetical protein [Agrobacterium rubi]